MQQLIAIDIGGTHIKYGIVCTNGDVLGQGDIPTLANQGVDDLLHRVAGLANKLKLQYSVQGLAISTAGQVDCEQGQIIYASPAIPGYQGCQVKARLEAATGLPTEVDNDVNCAMLGECWLGAGKGMRHGLMMTIGTGIGGAIWLDDKLYRGAGFSAGEWGYMQVAGEDYQTLASTSALICQVANACNISPEQLDGRKAFALAEHDINAAAAIEQYFDYLAEGIANLIYIFDPEKLILGGGISVRDDFLSRILTVLVKKLPEHLFKRVKIETAKLGNNAGFCGAAHHFMTKRSIIK